MRPAAAGEVLIPSKELQDAGAHPGGVMRGPPRTEATARSWLCESVAPRQPAQGHTRASRHDTPAALCVFRAPRRIEEILADRPSAALGIRLVEVHPADVVELPGGNNPGMQECQAHRGRPADAKGIQSAQNRTVIRVSLLQRYPAEARGHTFRRSRMAGR